MLIVAGWFAVAPSERDRVVSLHADVVRRARAAPGCVDLAVSPDPIAHDRVNTFELWESADRLRAWRAVARVPDFDTPILGGEVREHEIESSGHPFD